MDIKNKIIGPNDKVSTRIFMVITNNGFNEWHGMHVSYNRVWLKPNLFLRIIGINKYNHNIFYKLSLWGEAASPEIPNIKKKLM